ncbi:MAG: hypothetical protein A2X18_11680 [Bacteroidetes bacterium GWF2_40_14]|nr:MAG: hypothetical protein A2X18_11680 [Bacteroidetes bacterium GWF2_40_14]
MIYEKVIHDPGTTFSHKIYQHFTMPWHYHEEYELIVITSGGGRRFVGDYMDDYYPGDLVLFGANLPHFHMCYGLTENDPAKISGCEVLQFSVDIFPEKLACMSEFSVIADLLERSKRGVKFTNAPNIERITRMMRYIDRLTGVTRIFALMRILEFLGNMKNYKLLTSGGYSQNLVGDNANDPVNKVYRYLLNNFRNNITLDEVAAHIGFNSSALCRYFKRRAQKTIFECLADIRVSFARKLLSGLSMNISQIAYECGYRNIANFNRQFKYLTGHTPSQYRTLFEKDKDGYIT